MGRSRTRGIEMIEFDRSLNPTLPAPSPPGGLDLPTTNPLRGQVRALESKVESLETANAELRADVETLQGQVANKTNQLAQAQDDYDNLLQQAREAVQAAYDQGVQDVIDYLRNQGII